MKMLTKKLHNAYKETEKLADFLEKREWERTDELVGILDRAEREIKAIQDKAVGDVLAKLQGSYLREATAWANNEMTDLDRKPIKINKVERAKAQTELKRIQKVINKLNGLNGVI
jgi:hypothetical protein